MIKEWSFAIGWLWISWDTWVKVEVWSDLCSLRGWALPCHSASLSLCPSLCGLSGTHKKEWCCLLKLMHHQNLERCHPHPFQLSYWKPVSCSVHISHLSDICRAGDSLLHLPLLHMPLPLLGTHTVFTEPFLAGKFLFSGDSSDITSFERDCLSREVPLDEVSLLMATRAHYLMTYIFCFLHIFCSSTRLKVLGKQGSCLSYS